MYKEEAIELFTEYFEDEDDEFEFTRVEIALFEKFFREGGEFFLDRNQERVNAILGRRTHARS